MTAAVGAAAARTATNRQSQVRVVCLERFVGGDSAVLLDEGVDDAFDQPQELLASFLIGQRLD